MRDVAIITNVIKENQKSATGEITNTVYHVHINSNPVKVDIPQENFVITPQIRPTAAGIVKRSHWAGLSRESQQKASFDLYNIIV